MMSRGAHGERHEHLPQVRTKFNRRHRGRIGVIAQHAHAECRRHPRHAAADSPDANQPDRLAGEVQREPVIGNTDLNTA